MYRTASAIGATVCLVGVALAVGDPAAFGSVARAENAGARGFATDFSSAARHGPAASGTAHTSVPHNTTHTSNVPRSRTPTQNRRVNNSSPRHGSSVANTGPKFQKKFGPAGNKFSNTNNNVQNNTVNKNVGNTVNKNVGNTVNKNVFNVNKNVVNVNQSKLQLGPGKLNAGIPKQGNFPVIKLANNKIAPFWKQKKIWWGGGWKVFLPVTAIGVVLVGGSYYYPDGYLGVARPYCDGITPNGCRLNWQRVGFEGGGGDWQCVQFCPRPGAMPPPQAAALVAPPPVPQGRCEVAIYPDPKFAGTEVVTSDEQPRLSESGWQDQIASIQVRAGSWDFYTEENYGGETMRLPSGPYPVLTPEWTKHIGSFMCSQPGG